MEHINGLERSRRQSKHGTEGQKMTNREAMELADVICYAGYDWNSYVDECHEDGEAPHLSYDEFLAQSVIEAGYRKEREERTKGCKWCNSGSFAPVLHVDENRQLRQMSVEFCPMCGRPLKGEDNGCDKTAYD